VQKFYSGSVVKTAGKITFKVYICPENVISEPLKEWLLKAVKVTLPRLDFITLQEIPGGGSSSEQV